MRSLMMPPMPQRQHSKQTRNPPRKPPPRTPRTRPRSPTLQTTPRCHHRGTSPAQRGAAATHSLLLRTELLGAGVLSGGGAGGGAGAGVGTGGASSVAGGASSSSSSTAAAGHGVPPSPVRSGVAGSSPGRNIFRFKSERAVARQSVVRQFSLSPLGSASQALLASPRKPRRKVRVCVCVQQSLPLSPLLLLL